MAERETDWIRRMAGGDEKAFEWLYDANSRKVAAYLRTRNVDEQTAADVLQETFLAAWRSAGRYTGGAKPLTWLIAIARHKLADAVRVRERTRAAPLDAVTGGHDPTAENEDRLSLRQAVLALGWEQRELLHLVFVLGMSYAEAAVALEVPEGTVKSRMHTLKKQLAGRLEEGVGV